MLTVADGKLIRNHEFYVMKHLSHFVDVGAVRLETEGTLTGQSLAFGNPSGQIVIAARNCLPAPQNVDLTAAGSSVRLVLPPDSINTIVLPPSAR
jgi:glucosylceramidase